jgi:hypothetical protein
MAGVWLTGVSGLSSNGLEGVKRLLACFNSAPMINE